MLALLGVTGLPPGFAGAASAAPDHTSHTASDSRGSLADSPVPASAPLPARDTVWLAWLDAQNQVHRVVLDPEGRVSSWPVEPRTIPLGSLWKLAAYGRLVEAGERAAPYVCRGHDPEEVYCCEPGASIGREAALWRSCGRYFESALRTLRDGDPARSALLSDGPRALVNLGESIDPARTGAVGLEEWLQWLARWPIDVRERASRALLPYWLQGPGLSTLGTTGTRLRVKTFTTREVPDAEGAEPGNPSRHPPQNPPRNPARKVTEDGLRWAGASGWTQDGTPVWFAARGASASVVPTWAPRVLAYLDSQGALDAGRGALGRPAAAGSAGCVRVDYFADHPVRAITPQPAAPGPLGRGRHTLSFVNGQRLTIISRDDLAWSIPAPGRIAITGRLGLDDYVARVVEREGRGDPPAAARALAVAARTYLLGHAHPEGDCLAIADSSRTQRVAPRPPAIAARAAAAATEGLSLVGALGHYHADRAAPGVMAWTDAVRSAQRGADFVGILRNAYPDAALAALGDGDSPGASSCRPLAQAAAWLESRQAAWRRELAGEAGFRPPGQIQVCQLEHGPPHALPGLGRLYVSGARSLEERLTLTHEYLHLAFAGHPRGRDEHFIEMRARALLGLETPLTRSHPFTPPVAAVRSSAPTGNAATALP